MTKKDLLQILENGESSTIEFKEDDIGNDKFKKQIVKEMVSLLNYKGGKILIGVSDDASVKGMLMSANKTEEWVMNLCRENINPSIIPGWETFVYEGKRIVIITLDAYPADKPYKSKIDSKIYIRVGTTCREATREETARLFSNAPIGKQYILKPVHNTSIDDFDLRKAYEYFSVIRKLSKTPKLNAEKNTWITLLDNYELYDKKQDMATVVGLLLFGHNPHKYIPSAGITLATYKGEDKGSPATHIKKYKTSLLRLSDGNDTIIESGLIELSLGFLQQQMNAKENTSNGVREIEWDYPLEVLREAITNALVHRDYSLPTDVEISLYSNRIEIISPGRLPNSITPARMIAGCRASRNESIRDIMTEYKYIEGSGRGIQGIIIPKMKKHNNTKPILKEEETRFILTLLRHPL